VFIHCLKEKISQATVDEKELFVPGFAIQKAFSPPMVYSNGSSGDAGVQQVPPLPQAHPGVVHGLRAAQSTRLAAPRERRRRKPRCGTPRRALPRLTSQHTSAPEY
jgi:hypothetical protein